MVVLLRAARKALPRKLVMPAGPTQPHGAAAQRSPAQTAAELDVRVGRAALAAPIHPPRMHPSGAAIRIGERELYLEREGRGQRLLLLAGLGPAGSHAVFHPAFTNLAADHEVIYLDLFGRGRSGKPAHLDEIDFAGDAHDVAGLLELLGPSHVYGFSYGGLLAQQLALDRPGLVRSLALANTLHSPEMWQANHANINRELENQYPEVWEQILALRAGGIPSTAPEMQRLFAAAMRLVRFYNPDNAEKLAHLAEEDSAQGESKDLAGARGERRGAHVSRSRRRAAVVRDSRHPRLPTAAARNLLPDAHRRRPLRPGALSALPARAGFVCAASALPDARAQRLVRACRGTGNALRGGARADRNREMIGSPA